MPTVLLVRHGRTAANASGVLAPVPIRLAVASPLQRCQETAAALLAVPGPEGSPRPQLLGDDRLGECHYGDWTNRPLNELVKEKLWPVVQAHPSAVTFPGPQGESMPAMQLRAVSAIREYDARVGEEFGDHAVWMAVSHGDVIKAILADALGMHLDQFQRIMVDPCSVSVIRFTPLRPFAVRVNDSGTDLAALVPDPPKERPEGEGVAPDDGPSASDAVVGGSTGGAATSSGTS